LFVVAKSQFIPTDEKHPKIIYEIIIIKTKIILDIENENY
jgi:hypothetical protein